MVDERLPRPFGGYVLFEVLGAGGAGAVYAARARDAKIAGPVVIKILHPAVAGSSTQLLRFRQEAEVAVKIDHPNVVRVLDAGTCDEQPYLAMEYVVGWTSAEVIRASIRSGQGLPIAIAGGIVRQALAGVGAIHALDLVHRDLSPNNVMIDAEGVIRLIDLGLAKSHLRDWQTKTGTTMGSPGYIPPEQIAGDQISERADFYPLGVLLFELITARRMIRGKTTFELLRAALEYEHRSLTEIRRDVPPAIDEVVRIATARDPEDRFSSAAAFAAALERACPDLALPQAIERTLSALVAERKEERTRLFELSRTSVRPEPTRTGMYVEATPTPPARARGFGPAAIGLAVGLILGGGGVELFHAAGPQPIALRPPEEVPAPVIEAPEVTAVASEPVPSVRARATRRVPRSRAERPPPPPPPPRSPPARVEVAPPPPRPPSLLERRTGLTRRAEALIRAHPGDRALLKVIAELGMITPSSEPARAEETLEGCAKTLDGYGQPR